MKKVFSLLLAGIIVFTACKDEKAYKISGKTESENLNGKTVVIKQYDPKDKQFVTIDSTVIKDKKFTINGKVDSAHLVRILIDSVQPERMYLEPGEFVVNVDSLGMIVTGSKINDAYAELAKFRRSLIPKVNKTIAEYKEAIAANDTLKAKTLFDQFNGIRDEEMKKTETYLENNISNPLGESIFTQMISYLAPEKLKTLFGKTTDAFKNSKIGKKVSAKIESAEKTAIGKDYTNLTLENPDGKEISLSDYVGKGKYVLIDFWASWCGPCKQEMPNVVKAYKEFAHKGFEIVGISFDENKDAWTNAIKQFGMTWPQMSDLKGWDSKAAKEYGINSIPSTILLDKDGKIIAKNLRGEELSKKLGELLK